MSIPMHANEIHQSYLHRKLFKAKSKERIETILNMYDYVTYKHITKKTIPMSKWKKKKADFINAQYARIAKKEIREFMTDG